MSATPLHTTPEHLDVLVVGAGISGIDAGYRLQTMVPEKSYAILEARGQMGGTWDLFRYPGIRSDSDMYTLGFPFRPWQSDLSIADGTSIRTYVEETAREHGIDAKIRFHHRLLSADWSSEDQRWTVHVERTDTGQQIDLTCSFLFACTGYYRYDEGYVPPFPGTEDFRGQIVHPQFWSEETGYADRRVIVIGSGATAVTLVPALAKRAEHVTMLQRSPSYVVSLPAEDGLARLARRLLPAEHAYRLIRWKNVVMTTLFFQLSRHRPNVIKKLIRRGLERQLPAGYDIDTHFTPRYNPWDQRLCLVPDADLFEAIGSGRASVVTDDIETFTETGIRLASGGELEAELVVTATGLILQPLGGAEIRVDDRAIELPKTLMYRGCMLSDVPNFAFVFGYTNASWTLKSDLSCQYVARVLRHIEEHGYASCTPRNHDPSLSILPFTDFSSGYFTRAIDSLPRQGSKPPWRLNQNYFVDTLSLRRIPIDDGTLEFSPPAGARASSPSVAAIA